MSIFSNGLVQPPPSFVGHHLHRSRTGVHCTPEGLLSTTQRVGFCDGRMGRRLIWQVSNMFFLSTWPHIDICVNISLYIYIWVYKSVF